MFAMLISYVLSRTLVLTLAKYWLRTAAQEHAAAHAAGPLQAHATALRGRLRARARTISGVARAVAAPPAPFITAVPRGAFASLLIYPSLGRNFFPDVDAGQIKLHVRGPTGMRVEDTAALVDRVEAAVRQVIPPAEIDSVVDNIGLPVSSINMTYNNSGTIGSSDADILISLKPNHAPTADYVRAGCAQRLPLRVSGHELRVPARGHRQPDPQLRRACAHRRPDRGPEPRRTTQVANQLLDSFRQIPGLVDLRIQQVFNLPELEVRTDRTRAEQLGISQPDIANDLLLTLSGSGQIAPTFWLNPQNGICSIRSSRRRRSTG